MRPIVRRSRPAYLELRSSVTPKQLRQVSSHRRPAPMGPSGISKTVTLMKVVISNVRDRTFR